MKLRIAKKIYLENQCKDGCIHSWHTIEKASRLVNRAHRRGSRLLRGQRWEALLKDFWAFWSVQ